MCDRFKKPIVSTSANFSGGPSPIRFEDIPDEIKELVDHVVDYNQDKKCNNPSSVIKLGTNNEVKVIRE